MEHFIVCYDEEQYMAWPANGGIWSWGNEILVSFNRGKFDPQSKSLHRIMDKGREAVFAKSIDGGVSWNKINFNNDIYKYPLKIPPAEGFTFNNDGFVMRVSRPAVKIETDCYIVSNNRGISWDGPFAFPDFQYPLTSRTSYIIEGERKMRIFMSYSLPPKTDQQAYTDRAFVAVTEDGCVTWQFVGDITHDEPRSVMPIAVRLDDGALVAAVRRRMKNDFNNDTNNINEADDNWIEVSRSYNNGKTWVSPIRAATTYNPNNKSNNNGNPPALCRLSDNTLVLSYGRREPGCSTIRYCISKDGGRTFINDTILRDDPINEDMGYPRLIARPDDKCVAVYYIATADRPVQHIEATIFDPLAFHP